MTMSLLAALTSLTGLSGLIWAQEPPDPADGEVPVVGAPALEAELEALRASLAEAEAALAAGAGTAEELEQTLALLAVLLDGRQEEAARVAAAGALGQLADPSLIPFFYNAVHAGPADVKVAAIEALRSTPEPEVVDIASWALRRGQEDLSRAAMALLADIPEDAAAEVLYSYAQDPDAEEALRGAALAALQRGHADYLAARGTPTPPQRRAGGEAILGVVANSVAGGVLLSSIGVWGRSDAGVVIGAAGGALVGAGTGATYALTRPVTASNSLQYAAGVGWGLELGTLATLAIYDEAYPEERQSVAALLRAAGVTTGAVGAYLRFDNDIDPVDVGELNLSMMLGQQIGFGAASMALDAGYGYDGLAFQQEVRPRMLAGIGGAAVGAAAGLALRERWQLGQEDLLFAGVTGAQLLWLGSWLPVAINDRGYMGAPRFTWAAGTSAALALAELAEPSVARTGSMAYGFLAGTALGAGVPLLAEDDRVQPVAASMLAFGALGSGLGFLVGERLSLDEGSYATLGVGLPLLVAQTSGYAFVLDQRGVLDGPQPAGLILSVGGAGAAGLLGLTQVIHPSPGQAVVAGSGAAWGAWYGVLVPITLGAEPEPGQRMLTTLVVSDLGLVGAALLQTDAVGLEPRSTLIPQIGGVSGATLGALGAALFTGDGQAIAGGAVVGSLLGFGAGALVEVRLADRREVSLGTPRPQVDLPGRWSVMASPTVMEDGSMGAQVGVTASGL